MQRNILTLLVFVIGTTGLLCAGKSGDSLKRKQGFHVLASIKPMVKWMSRKDSMENFFYSKVQFELQYNYKGHNLGIGIDGNRRKFSDDVNGLPTETDDLKVSLAPYYSYRFYSNKRWKYFMGVGYIYNYEDRLNKVISKIEVTTKSYALIEEGADVFFRVNYRLNRHLSLELESAFYFTRTRTEYKEDYPLTPSMNAYKSYYQSNRTYAFPSNVFIKFSF